MEPGIQHLDRGKARCKHIENYSKSELQDILDLAQEEEKDVVDFECGMWSLVALDSYLRTLAELGELDVHDQGKSHQEEEDESRMQTVENTTEAVSGACKKRKRESKSKKPPVDKPKIPYWAKKKPKNFTQLARNEQLAFDDASNLAAYQRISRFDKAQAKRENTSQMSRLRRANNEAAAKATNISGASTKSVWDEEHPKQYHDFDLSHLTVPNLEQILADSEYTYSGRAETTTTAVAGSDTETRAQVTPEEPRKYAPQNRSRLHRDIQRLSTWQDYLSEYYSGKTDEFTQDQKDKIKELGKRKPRYLYHTHSRTGPRRTEGSADESLMAPAAATTGKNVYPSIYDFPTLSALIKNFGRRILWLIQFVDQFSSYTTSLLFALVHALGRKMKGETGITISCIDTDKVRTIDGQAVEFYYVPELEDILGVADWKQWTRISCSLLLAPWFTHEYVVHGSMALTEEHFRMAPLEEFEEAGLHEFLPGFFDDDEEHDMCRLYMRCVEMRVLWHSLAVPAPFSIDHLDRAAKLAKLFVPHDVSSLDESSLVSATHFQIFVDFVALSRRQGHEAIFEQYIRDNFTAASIQDVIHPNVHVTPNNLPENIEALKRIRQACVVFSIPQVPDRKVVCVDHDFDFEGRCATDIETKFPALRSKRLAKERALRDQSPTQTAVMQLPNGVSVSIATQATDDSSKFRTIGESSSQASDGWEVVKEAAVAAVLEEQVQDEEPMLALTVFDREDAGSDAVLGAKQL